MAERMSLRWSMGSAVATCATGGAIGRGLGIAVASAVAMVAVLALLAFVRVSVTHRALARRLRHRSTATEVAGTRLRVGPVGGSVFVAGLVRPEIFCDRMLLDELDDAELRAVTLHERAHQLARDPLRGAAAAVVAPVLTQSAAGQAWLERRAAAREIAADRYALLRGVDRRTIASALSKVPPAGAVHAAGFAPAVELRLRALLGEDLDVAPRCPWPALAFGALVGAGMCLTML